MAKTPSEEFSSQSAAGAFGDRHAAAGAAQGGFFGHPKGLSTLFFTEMWERFSYYGMRAILILFMTASVVGENPGLGLSVGTAAAVYGLYTFFVYVLSLPGGWVADKLWGQRKAVFVGGVIIMLGHVSLAVASDVTFYLGLALIVTGTGLLKPNVSAMVGELYPEGGARRDAGFSIFYMSINIGAFVGQLAVGYVGENINYHWGFSLAAIGMLAGLIQYKMGGRYLGTAGALTTDDTTEQLRRRSQTFYAISAAFVGLVLLVGYLLSTGALGITVEQLAAMLGYIVVALAIFYFLYLTFFGGLTTLEKKRLWVIFWLFILAAIFWSGFEQAGSSLNLFARDLTDRTFFGWEMPASWLQSINPLFIIIFAPIFGWLWTYLASRNANPSIPVKFSLGLLGLAAGFFVLAWGGANATEASPVSPSWLVVTYFFHTAGELCLSPVGLSSITKLAPRGRVGQMMGVWFIGAALGNLFAGLVAGELEQLAPASLFWQVALFVGGAGIVALLLAPPVRKLIGNVE